MSENDLAYGRIKEKVGSSESSFRTFFCGGTKKLGGLK